MRTRGVPPNPNGWDSPFTPVIVSVEDSVTITVSAMRPKLLTLDETYDRLSTTEPLKRDLFSFGDPIRFLAETNAEPALATAAGSDPSGVHVTLGTGQDSRTHPLTRDALTEACQTFKLSAGYVKDCPPGLLVPHLNYWFREGLADVRGKQHFSWLIRDQHAIALTKQAVAPISNLRLLDAAVCAIQERYGRPEILVDYKFTHNLRQTAMRLIVPTADRTMTGTGTPDDIWSIGVNVRNSLTGATQTGVDGYLFRWICTNGQIDTRSTGGHWTRRKDTTEAEALEWAHQAVDDALSGLDGSLDKVQGLAGLSIDRSLGDTLRDIFEHYRIPAILRNRIIAQLEQHDGEVTMYVILSAITSLANESGMDDHQVETLMRHGGDFTHTAESRCQGCHRMLHQH